MNDFSNERLLVIAPHSDDEVLGCGGLISKIKKAGGKVYVLIFNLGFEKDDTKESQEKRKKEVQDAMNLLNVDDFHLVHDTPDNNRDLDAKPLHSLIEIIESSSPVSLEKIEPTMVAIPTIFSHHQDHVHVHNACIAALRPISTPVSDIVLSYEAPEHSRWSAAGVFEPNFFVEIDDVIDQKIQAFSKYKSQIRPGGRDADSIRNQAKYRGQEVGKNLCEAFYVHRFIL
ncbi:PIG-L family deacetylase [Candidatus Nitrosopelagicus sp.]|nr:PIG-L family deacetylase [Candidatus Nitrosopelagicus sp.]